MKYYRLSRRFHCLGYADDIAVVVRGKSLGYVSEKTQRALNIVDQWCRDVGLSINPLKTVVVPFTRRRALEGLNCPVLNEVTIPFSKEAKYLGVIFD